MDDDGSQVEENTRYFVGVRCELLSSQKTVEENLGLWKGSRLYGFGNNGSRIWRSGGSNMRKEIIL
jgi:hypothetical protein